MLRGWWERSTSVIHKIRVACLLYVTAGPAGLSLISSLKLFVRGRFRMIGRHSRVPDISPAALAHVRVGSSVSILPNRCRAGPLSTPRSRSLTSCSSS